MRRICLQVAYDGTGYHGWQLQPAKRTVESELNVALSALTGETVCVSGASRTDAGVHALENYAVFDTRVALPGDKFAYALNQRLPEDIRIRESREVAAFWHPRKCASIKTYEYRILNETFPNPLERLYAHFTYYPLDVALMQEGGAFLVGEHDFRSFCSVHTQAESTVRKVTALEIRRVGNLLTLRVSGNGFLYNMVRIIAGTLMEVGRGKYPPEKIAQILAGCDRKLAGPTAPARGLTLISYRFKEEIPDSENNEKTIDTDGGITYNNKT